MSCVYRSRSQRVALKVWRVAVLLGMHLQALPSVELSSSLIGVIYVRRPLPAASTNGLKAALELRKHLHCIIIHSRKHIAPLKLVSACTTIATALSGSDELICAANIKQSESIAKT